MNRARYAALLVVALALPGCASVERQVGDWFGDEPPSAKGTDATGGQVYYAGSDGLAVHATASGSSRVVGRLALHQKVVRSEIERGYAHVASDDGALSGWVDNAQLVWRVPAVSGSTAPQAAAPSAADAAPGAATTAPPASAAAPSVPEAGKSASDDPAVPAPAASAPAAAAHGDAAGDPTADASTAGGTAEAGAAPAIVPIAQPTPAPGRPRPEMFDPF